MIGKGFDVEINGQKVGITFSSLLWFWAVTATATVLGEIAYYYLQKYLPQLPNTSAIVVKNANAVNAINNTTT